MKLSEKLAQPKAALEDRVAELLIRYELGHFDARSRRALAQIFKDSPPNAWERLEAACDHLSVTGANLTAWEPHAVDPEKGKTNAA